MNPIDGAPERGQRWMVDRHGQRAFARWSGDHNPLHADELVARRLPFGRVSVHGMYLILDALDRAIGATDRTPSAFRCIFRHPIAVGDPIDTAVGPVTTARSLFGTRAEIDPIDTEQVKVRVSTDVWTAADITVEFNELDELDERGGLGTPPDAPIALPPDTTPIDHSIESLIDLSGTIPVEADIRALAQRVPHLIEALGMTRTSELISLTKLVGMHVPGRSSLDSQLDIEFRPRTEGAVSFGNLAYAVDRVDQRFRLVSIDVESTGLHGTIKAFFRHEPVDYATADALVVPVDSTRFAGARVLVVGGSRGMGSVAVQQLAAGGADVRFTFRTGRADAAAISARTSAAAWRFESGHRIDPALLADWPPTHLAYFATPPMNDGVAGVYSKPLVERLTEVYADHLALLVDRLAPLGLQGVLMPSTIAIDEPQPGMAEFADAKRFAEHRCTELAQRYPMIEFHTPRLGRQLTDQTRSFLPTEYSDTPRDIHQAMVDLLALPSR